MVKRWAIEDSSGWQYVPEERNYGNWVRYTDYQALAAELAESRAMHKQAFDLAIMHQTKRGEAEARIREIEAALPHLLDFRLIPMFDAKGTYTQRKADEWSKRLSDFRVALTPSEEVKS